MKKGKVVCTTVVTSLIISELCFLAPYVLAQNSSKRNLIFVGTVRNNIGRLYRFSGQSATFNGNAKWDTCPQGTRLIGRDFQSNGFWLCASSDIANSGTFHFGNVVGNRGFYWEISGGRATTAGEEKWDTCWEGRYRGHLFEPNGFWVCQP